MESAAPATQAARKALFLEAYDNYADEIYRFCLFKVTDAERAQDFTQDVFARFWQNLRTGQAVAYPRALLFTIARNRVIDWYRKKKEQSLDALQEEGADFAGSGSREVELSAEHREALEAVETLDEPSREAVLLRFVEGWTPSQIAELTGESANVISVRLNRAIKKLQERLHVHE